MKKVIHLLLLLFSLNLTAQEISINTLRAKQDSLTADIHYIQNCLQGYYKERQVAYSLAFSSVVIAAMGYICLYNQNDKSGAYVGFGLSAVCSISSAIVFYDSEKWLKRACIQVSPGSVRFTF